MVLLEMLYTGTGFLMFDGEDPRVGKGKDGSSTTHRVLRKPLPLQITNADARGRLGLRV